jgi:ADP-ribosyl-[dinitrogen reductase] hydrolase
MSDATENAFLGALLGMAIGDALGAPVAGLNRDEIAARFGRVEDYLAAPDTGEEAPTGEFTDETEIALCIVESMTANQGRLDPETAGARMRYLAAGPSRRWMKPATLAALATAADFDYVVPLDEDSPATGDVASRGVPVGLVHAVVPFSANSLRADAEAVVRLTHGGPAAFNAATAVAFAVRLAASGEPPSNWARQTADFLGGGELASGLSDVDRQVSASVPLASLLAESGTGLDALESVPAAFVAAMSEPVFEDAVFAAVNAGGATDTIGAITGALAGAAAGASGIPQQLIDGLEGRIYLSLAAPWLYKAARQRAGHLIDIRPVHGRRPEAPPRI